MQRPALFIQHFCGKIDRAVACGFRADEAAAPVEAFAGEHARKFVAQPLVHAEHVAYFAPAHADIARRDIGIRPDVAGEFDHEALAEALDFHGGFALGVEVGAAFAAAHGQRGKGVFEHLLKGKEFEDAQIHRGMEPQPALVRADGAVHFYAVAPVDVHVALVVHPRHAEEDDPFRLHNALKDAGAAVFRIAVQNGFDGFRNLAHGLMEFPLVGVAAFDDVQNLHGMKLLAVCAHGRAAVCPARCRR